MKTIAHSYETEFFGGPLDGYGSCYPWIPLSGMQIVTSTGNRKAACYECTGTKFRMVDGVPQLTYQLQYHGYRRSALRAGREVVIQWLHWFGGRD